MKHLSEHKKEFQTEKMHVAATLHVSDNLMPNDDTLSEIEAVASEKNIFHHIAAMSDVHSKKGRKNPTGTIVASEHHLFPQINDTAPNCGMRFLKTNLTDKDLTPDNIEKLFQELIRVIPTKTFIGTVVPYSLIMDICRKGVAPVRNFFNTRTKNEIENTFEGGNFFKEIPTEKDILNAIPKLFLHIGKYRLGILGAAGNHFLDLMKISEIKNPEIAEKFGLKTGQYVFLLHTGSGLLGQYASYLYTPKKKEHLSQKIVLELGKFFFKTAYKKAFKKLWDKIEKFKDNKEYFSYNEKSLEGKLFLTAHNAAANQGYANRSILNHKLDLAIEKILKKNPELDMLYDMPHVYIHRESHLGADVWVHRNGTVRADSPMRMKDHPLFSKTGEPVFIPSSMSTAAYICAGIDGNESSFYSASHGTGRRKEPLTDATQNKKDLFKKMEKSNVKLYNAKSNGVIMQDSAYYKDIEEVITGMEDNGIVKVVAKMEPIAVLMY